MRAAAPHRARNDWDTLDTASHFRVRVSRLAVQPRIAGYFHELLLSSKGYNDPFGALAPVLRNHLLPRAPPSCHSPFPRRLPTRIRRTSQAP